MLSHFRKMDAFASVVAVLEISMLAYVAGQFSFPRLTAKQNRTYIYSTADRAIDGNLQTCSVTAYYDYSWWQADLGDIFRVYSVTVTVHSIDGAHPWYVQNFTVSVGTTDRTDMTPASEGQCYYYNTGSYVPPAVPLKLTCTRGPLHGRYVTFKKQGGDRLDAIGFCEVDIEYYAVGDFSLYNVPTNQAVGYTNQHNVFDGAGPANEMKSQTCAFGINPSGGESSWYFDLREVRPVGLIIVYTQGSNVDFGSGSSGFSYHVRVGNSTDYRTEIECCFFNSTVSLGAAVICTCPSMTSGRYVSVIRSKPGLLNNPQALVVCEVSFKDTMATDVPRSTSATTFSDSHRSMAFSATKTAGGFSSVVIILSILLALALITIAGLVFYIIRQNRLGRHTWATGPMSDARNFDQFRLCDNAPKYPHEISAAGQPSYEDY